MQHAAEPEQTQQHQLVEKQVWYHGKAPSHGGEMGALYPFCKLLNYLHDRGTRPYAHVSKRYRRKRVVGVHHQVVFGTRAAVEQVLVARGWKINTSFVERFNLDIRQRVAAVGRRVNTLCQGEGGI
jgi:hypothetical protein